MSQFRIGTIMSTGWSCPNCLRVYNPDVDFCTCMLPDVYATDVEQDVEDELGFVNTRVLIEQWIDGWLNMPADTRRIAVKMYG